jgi:hypothetical protein
MVLFLRQKLVSSFKSIDAKSPGFIQITTLPDNQSFSDTVLGRRTPQPLQTAMISKSPSVYLWIDSRQGIRFASLQVGIRIEIIQELVLPAILFGAE